MKQTAVEQLGIAFRQWQKDWDNFEKTGRNKPASYDEFIQPFLEMENQQQDDFAIGFAEWCIKKRIDFFDSTEIGETYTINGFVSRYKMSELLEIYKKEKGL
jgi:hypothetical protein